METCLLTLHNLGQVRNKLDASLKFMEMICPEQFGYVPVSCFVTVALDSQRPCTSVQRHEVSVDI